MLEPIFKTGDKVKCLNATGYLLTKGKVYEISEYEPKFRLGNFTFPPYVKVIGDNGKMLHCHATRFKLTK